MFGTAFALTAVTLTGLVAGFAREWLLVAGWGAGGRTDAFLVATFLPEAIRMVLTGGILSSAGLAIWNACARQLRPAWVSETTASLGLVAVALALLLCLGAPFCVRLVGPGLSPVQHGAAVDALRLLAWVIPGVVLQAWWSVPLQSEGRFLLPGLGSLLFNLPAIVYMGMARTAATERGMAFGFLVGSVLMSLPLLVPVVRLGLSPRLLRPRLAPVQELWAKVLPLATGAVAAQGLQLVERIVASFLGEGSLTVINLARKLINVPLIALASLNQVLLGLMSRHAGTKRLSLLRRGLVTTTIVSLPAALALILGSAAIVALLFGKIHGNEHIQPLLAWYAVSLPFVSWNLMIARYSYASGDTRLPLVCELAGVSLQLMVMPLLAWLVGTQGVAIALVFGTLLTGYLLVRRHRLWGQTGIGVQAMASVVGLVLAGAALPAALHLPILAQLALAAAVGVVSMAALAAWLRPWRGDASVPTSPAVQGVP